MSLISIKTSLAPGAKPMVTSGLYSATLKCSIVNSNFSEKSLYLKNNLICTDSIQDY